VSSLLRGGRHDVQSREEAAEETSTPAPGQAGGSNELSTAEETTAGITGETDEHDGFVCCCVRRNACYPIAECMTVTRWVFLVLEHP